MTMTPPVALEADVEMLRRWADVLDIPSGRFVNEDLRAIADRIAVLAQQVADKDAEIERLRGELAERTGERDRALSACGAAWDSIRRFPGSLHDRAMAKLERSLEGRNIDYRDPDLAASEQSLSLCREAADRLNVDSEELLRIRNRCEHVDGDIKIWSRMLQKLTDHAREIRAALRSNGDDDGR